MLNGLGRLRVTGTVPPPVSFEVEKQSAPSEESFVEGVVAEAKNIEWPALGQVPYTLPSVISVSC